MAYVPEGEEEPPQLRRLRLLVMSLGAVLIVGFVAMVATIVIRLGFGGEVPPAPVSADGFRLPPGKIVATGRGADSVMFVIEGAEGERLLVFDAATGERTGDAPIVRD